MAHPTDPESKQPELKLQLLTAILIALVVFLQYLLWIAEDGVRQTYALRVSIQAQTEENAELTERNRALEADILDLKNGLMAIEERARSEMGMIRPDETFYRILEQPLPNNPAVEPGKPGDPAHKPATAAAPKTPSNPALPKGGSEAKRAAPVKLSPKPAKPSKPPVDDAVPD
ncbi:MAG: cell division protein FtsB [Gammaproteobacteria bacterium]|jgi:cell division protein FtsB|nr:cell division protein FtsB [Gammaproteobacteria bacterium]